MLTVTIPVHPLSRAIILAEHGYEPVVLDNHDILFEIINSRITPDDLRKKPKLAAFIELTVNDRLAAHLAQYGFVAGLRLFKFHKHIMCRYADAQTRAKGKGHARPALQEFLNLYGVEEDAYGLDTAYKLFQRFNWEIQKKNPHFAYQKRRKPGAFLINARKECAEHCPMLDVTVNLSVFKFMELVRQTFKRFPRALEQQARTYIYMDVLNYNQRQIAKIEGITQPAVCFRLRAMRRRIRANATYARLLEESLALPEPA